MLQATARSLTFVLVFVALSTSASLSAEEEKGEKAKAEAVCAKDAVFETLGSGFRFTEGPAADMMGNVFFSDIPNERIHRYDATTGKLTVFREKSGKSNGLMFGRNGRLYACEGGARRVARVEADGKTTTTVASHWKGKRLNSPNDLALDADGGIWFTDPRYGRRQDDREIDVEAVYYVDAKGVVHQRIADLKRPNGIALSIDGRTLYVADNSARLVMAYPVTAPGVIGTGRLFARMDAKERGGPDGMCLDERGNVYAAGQKKIWIWSPAGTLLRTLTPPEAPANCTFGGPQRRTLYVTARKGFYRIPMLVRGAPVLPQPRDGKARPQAAPPGAGQ